MTVWMWNQKFKKTKLTGGKYVQLSQEGKGKSDMWNPVLYAVCDNDNRPIITI